MPNPAKAYVEESMSDKGTCFKISSDASESLSVVQNEYFWFSSES
jgi:hypothetical protein